MTATEQLDRLLLLLSKLETDAPQRIADLAEELQVDARTLQKDLKALVTRDHPEPAGFMESITVAFDGETVWSERPSSFRRPMALTRQEAIALDVALAMLMSDLPEGDYVMLEGVRKKLKNIRLDARDPQQGAIAIRVGQVDGDARAYRARLEECAADRRLAELKYLKPDAIEPTNRTVGPLGFSCVRGVWYLYARNGADGDVRQFRLDRVQGVKTLDSTFEAPTGFALEATIKDGRPFLNEVDGRVTIRYRGPAARWVAEDEGGAVQADGSLVKEYPLADPDWAVRQVLRWGVNAEVVAPQGVRARVLERLAGL